MQLLLLAIAGCVLILYCIRMIRYAIALPGNLKQPEKEKGNKNLKVSLIIPVRNEYKNLPDIIEDIENQDYPSNLTEIIFINDHSEDGSGRFLSHKVRESSTMKYFSLEGPFEGKKKAIEMGIVNASGEWIIQTDADCRIAPGFISAHAAEAVSMNAGLIAGPVLPEDEKGIWSKFEIIEYLGLSASTMASFFSGRPIMCSGASLSYPREFYMQERISLGRVDSSSGDDMFLLQQALKRRGKLSYIATWNAEVKTRITGSPLQFMRQRIRWGSKAKLYSNREMILMSMLVWFTNSILAGGVILTVYNPELLPFIVTYWILKSGSEIFLLYRFTRLFQNTSMLWWFLPTAIIYYFYITVTGLIAMSGKFRWKGRTYSTGNMKRKS